MTGVCTCCHQRGVTSSKNYIHKSLVSEDENGLSSHDSLWESTITSSRDLRKFRVTAGFLDEASRHTSLQNNVKWCVDASSLSAVHKVVRFV